MFQLVYTNRFRKDVKLLKKRGFDMELLKSSILQLEESGTLPVRNRPHKLSGYYVGFWEAHLNPDWLILWKVIPDDKEVWSPDRGG